MSHPAKALHIKAFSGLAFLALVMAIVVFVSAGTVRYIEGWVFLANFVAIAADNSGKVFTSDGARIRTIDSSGNVVTRAGVPLLDPAAPRDGNAATAVLSAGPLAVDASGNVYVGERTCVRRISPAGDVSTLSYKQHRIGAPAAKQLIRSAQPNGSVRPAGPL